LINNFSTVYIQNNDNSGISGSPEEIRTPVRGSRGPHD
jgi:hypothetical protein